MAKVQRLGRNSTITNIKLASSVSDDVPLPEGVILRSEDEMIIWRQFTRARALNDWRDCDLLIIEQAVKAKADIRKYQIELDKTGAILINERGTPVVNPLVSIVDTLTRQFLSLSRSISLMQTETDSRTKNAIGKKQNDFRNLINGTDDLIGH